VPPVLGRTAARRRQGSGIISQDEVELLLKVINRPTTAREISDKLSMNHSTVQHNLIHLVRAGKIHKGNDKGRNKYRILSEPEKRAYEDVRR
jgi:predicted transcriptional regulator